MKQVIPMDGIMSAGILRRWGTIYNNLAGAVNGDSPMKNWDGSVADFGSRHYRRLDPDRFISRETRKYHCYSCVIGCGGVLDVSDVIAGVKHSHKPEYETACSFGALCLNDDLETILRCNEIQSVTVVRMEVPCCGGIEHAVKGALLASGKMIPWQVVTISTDGSILE